MPAKRVKLSALTTAELVQRFTELAAQHGDAIYHCETARANRIYPIAAVGGLIINALFH
jgi:hypothetical protein